MGKNNTREAAPLVALFDEWEPRTSTSSLFIATTGPGFAQK